MPFFFPSGIPSFDFTHSISPFRIIAISLSTLGKVGTLGVRALDFAYFCLFGFTVGNALFLIGNDYDNTQNLDYVNSFYKKRIKKLCILTFFGFCFTIIKTKGVYL